MISSDFRDRTNEFNAIAECVKRQTASQNASDSKKGGSNSAVTKTGKSQFSIIATSIGRDIHRTSEKIARLTERKKYTVKYKNVFIYLYNFLSYKKNFFV